MMDFRPLSAAGGIPLRRLLATLALTCAASACRAVPPSALGKVAAPEAPPTAASGPVSEIPAGALPPRLHYSDSLGSDLGDLFGLSALGGTLDLSEARLEQTASAPGQDVDIDNVPTGAGMVRVAILAPDGSVYTWAMLRDLGDPDRIAMMTPALPPSVLSGGDASLVVSVRGAQSPTLKLAISAPTGVDPSQGAEAMIKELGENVDNDALSGGKDGAFAFFVHAILDDPNNPNSMEKILGGTAEILGGTASVAPSTIDEVIAKAGVVDSLATFQSATAAFAPPSAAIGAQALRTYRTQSCCPAVQPDSPALTDAITGLQRQAADLQTLQADSISAENALTQAAAALSGLAPTEASSDLGAPALALDVLAVPNEAIILNYIQALHDAALQPSQITLYPPQIFGTAGGDGSTFVPAVLGGTPEVNTGYWRVSGTITNGPVAISDQGVLNLLTVPQSLLIPLATQMQIQFGVLAAADAVTDAQIALNHAAVDSCNYWNGVGEEAKAKLGILMSWWKPSNCGDLESPNPDTYLNFANNQEKTFISEVTSSLQYISYDPSTSEFSISGQGPLYTGDLTNHVEAEIAGSAVSAVPGQPTEYQVNQGDSNSTLIIKTIGLPVQAESSTIIWTSTAAPPATSSDQAFLPSSLEIDGVQVAQVGFTSGLGVPDGNYSLSVTNENGLTNLVVASGPEVLWHWLFAGSVPQTLTPQWGTDSGFVLTLDPAVAQVSGSVPFSVENTGPGGSLDLVVD